MTAGLFVAIGILEATGVLIDTGLFELMGVLMETELLVVTGLLAALGILIGTGLLLVTGLLGAMGILIEIGLLEAVEVLIETLLSMATGVFVLLINPIDAFSVLAFFTDSARPTVLLLLEDFVRSRPTAAADINSVCLLFEIRARVMDE
jgi:hypothetical protein